MISNKEKPPTCVGGFLLYLFLRRFIGILQKLIAFLFEKRSEKDTKQGCEDSECDPEEEGRCPAELETEFPVDRVAECSDEEDEAVDRLDCWDPNMQSVGELARVAVLPQEQSRGLGRIVLQFGMDELKRRGYKGIHMLVNKYNTKAIRCYAVFGFRVVGECYLYEQDYLCYEKELV